ncbi:bifunctional levopimaradiene synthase, chloroplastic isoform X2 [Cryptomeria japonica]|uniref:bifunctional levopimaradiene synthase, chloroplastic isoform X2 n=1 Tax=Cryptomeria japonica TaxID=3369 RepID=UPI0025AC8A4D|nr:bifunctional levopimaradiene synthase, chloroplastic isoform X2 [Cryptomeria japonica]
MAATVYPPSMWNDDAINSLTEIHMPLEHHKHIEALIEDIRNMFQSMEDGKLNPSAYDTAWIARIASIDNPSQPQFPQTLNWVVCNQLSDGSWGGEPFYLSHDRLLITLSCVIALRIWKLGETQVQKGIDFVNYQTSLSLDERGYGNQPSGFVILFSSLLKEANALNLGISNELPFIQRILAIREAQLKENDMGILYNLPTSLFLSLEGLQEVIDWRKVLKFYPKDGYMLGSLASTACLYMHTGDKIFLEFINSVVTICGDHVPCVYPSDLHERLLAVDTVERLGIGRYFKEEIKHALDYVYRFWSNGGIGRGRNDTIVNVNDTAMGFRILRLHGYDVSAEVLKIFENEKREFFSFADKTHRGVEDMLSLYKCSEIGFPGETVMKEAKTFTATYLRNLRETNNSFALARDVSGSFAVDYELKYGFHRSLPRLEARFYIEGSWLSNKTWLAKTFYRWDLYMLDHMSEHIKIFFLGLYNTINELAEKACKVQGNEMLEYFKKMWKVQLESFTKEAEWSKHKHVPRWDEYITISKVSIGFGTSILTSIHLMGEVITDSILCQIDERSKAHYLVCLSTRLVNDTKTFKAEREYGELASAIECYMKDNPRALEEVALDHVYDVIEDGLTELNQELFKYVELPSCFQNLLLN